jgi:hypothetical protein
MMNPIESIILNSEWRKLKVWAWTSYLQRNVHAKFHEEPYNYYLVIKCVETVITTKEVRLGVVRFVMRMRRGSWVMTSSFHLAILSIRHERITECENLEIMSFHEWPMAQRPYQISRISAQLFMSYYMRTNGYQLWTRQVRIGSVKVGKVRSVMRMRWGSWVMASSSFHLTTSNNRHVDIIECSTA